MTVQRAVWSEGTPTILAVDPGPHAGLVVVSPDTKLLYHYDNIATTEWVQFYSLMRVYRPSVVVVELFIAFGKVERRAVITMECVGVVKVCAQLLTVPVVGQTPNKIQGWEKIAKERLHHITRNPHVCDAYAHALAFVDDRVIP